LRLQNNNAMNRTRTALPIRSFWGLSMLFFLVLGWGCGDTDFNETTVEPGNHLEQVLSQQDQLSAFADAINRAGLSHHLQSQSLMFTLFAPSNDAFTSYLQTNGYASLAEVPEATLASLVRYHIGFGRTLAVELDSARLINTFDDRKIFVYTSGNGEVITLNNQAQVVESDILARNGVIHVLGQVLTPPTQSLGAYILARTEQEQAEFTLLYAALQQADLLPLVNSNKSSFTLFAPTDAAFAAAGYPTAEEIQAEDPAELRNLLQYHLLPRYRFTSMFPNGDVSSLQGKKVTLSADNRTIKGQGNEHAASLLANEQDILTTNGILHAIDKVLLPGQ
jgi:uncharacterized surface protein with fasciclin (FAS1) repeats